MIAQLLEIFGDIQPFLEENSDVGTGCRPRMLAILQDPTKSAYLKVELAAIVDAGKQLVQATYNLEGDGPLILHCYEQIEATFNMIQIQHFPNTDAVIRQLPVVSPSRTAQQWKAYTLGCVQPGFDYFSTRFRGQLSTTLAAFKAARLFLPQKIGNMQPLASEVDSLQILPFLRNMALLTSMKSELPMYLSRASDVALNVDPLSWWKQQSSALPNWATAVCLVLLIQPSSAAAERVFSILSSSFGDRQDCSLQDYVESSLMLQYNR